MDPQNTQAAPPAAAPDTVVDATNPAPQSTPPATQPPASDDVTAQPSKAEWVEYRKTQRKIEAQQSQILEVLGKLAPGQAPPPPAQPATQTRGHGHAPQPAAPVAPATATAPKQVADPGVAAILARQEFDDALDELGIELPKPAKKVMRDNYVALRPADRASWIQTQVDAFGLNRPAVQAPVVAAPRPIPPPLAPPVPATDTGPPAGKTPVIPGHPGAIPTETLQQMKPEEIVQVVNRYLNRSGQGHPAADIRARREAARRNS